MPSKKLNKNKERAYIEKCQREAAARVVSSEHESFKCLRCRQQFVFKSAFLLHDKECTLVHEGAPVYGHYALTPDELSEVRGDKYAEQNAEKQPWTPEFHLQKYANVVVAEEYNEDTQQTKLIKKMKWITTHKFYTFQDLLNHSVDDDTESVYSDAVVVPDETCDDISDFKFDKFMNTAQIVVH